jgi:serine phosphatase RsbU (regulator of sigma subunit)
MSNTDVRANSGLVDILVYTLETSRAIGGPNDFLPEIAEKLSRSLGGVQVAFFIQVDLQFVRVDRGVSGDSDKFDGSSRIVKAMRALPAPTYLDLEQQGFSHDVANPPFEDDTVLLRLESNVIVPIGAGGHLRGFVSLGRKPTEQAYSNTELRHVCAICQAISLSLESHELRSLANSEADSAREIQQRQLPQLPPNVPGLELSMTCKPLRAVGGDYYDLLPVLGGKFAIVVGDVAGKGLSAALVAAAVATTLRTEVKRAQADLTELMIRLNRVICNVSPPSYYVTLFYAVYDPKTLALEYVSAGHFPPALRCRNTSNGIQVMPLDVGGTVIGLLVAPPTPFKVGRVLLEPEDVLLVATDGVTDATNWRGDRWGLEHLQKALLQHYGKPAFQLRVGIESEMEAFMEGAPPNDDLTLVVARVVEA